MEAVHCSVAVGDDGLNLHGHHRSDDPGVDGGALVGKAIAPVNENDVEVGVAEHGVLQRHHPRLLILDGLILRVDVPVDEHLDGEAVVEVIRVDDVLAVVPPQGDIVEGIEPRVEVEVDVLRLRRVGQLQVDEGPVEEVVELAHVKGANSRVGDVNAVD